MRALFVHGDDTIADSAEEANGYLGACATFKKWVNERWPKAARRDLKRAVLIRSFSSRFHQRQFQAKRAAGRPRSSLIFWSFGIALVWRKI